MESMGKKKPRPRRSFTPEFKAEIVELCRRGDRSVGQVAKEALFIETARIGTADQRRISPIVERLNWKRQPVDWQGKRWWTP